MKNHKANNLVTSVVVMAVLISIAGLLSCNAQSKRKSDSTTTITMSDTAKKRLIDDPELQKHLTEQEKQVLVKAHTDRPGDGGYTNVFDSGVYVCRACSTPLYNSSSKFRSHCGWPSFDQEIHGAVTRISDTTLGMARVEIVCTHCKGHLGHVFEGEAYTETNTRHCVNTSSLKFISTAKDE